MSSIDTSGGDGGSVQAAISESQMHFDVGSGGNAYEIVKDGDKTKQAAQLKKWQDSAAKHRECIEALDNDIKKAVSEDTKACNDIMSKAEAEVAKRQLKTRSAIVKMTKRRITAKIKLHDDEVRIQKATGGKEAVPESERLFMESQVELCLRATTQEVD